MYIVHCFIRKYKKETCFIFTNFQSILSSEVGALFQKVESKYILCLYSWFQTRLKLNRLPNAFSV